jgi:hypothetical protein
MSIHPKYHFKENYEMLYHKLTGNHYKREITRKMTPMQLMTAINVALVVKDCIPYDERELLNIAESMQEND